MTPGTTGQGRDRQGMGQQRMDWQDGGRPDLTIGGRRLEGACVGPAPDVAPTVVLLHEGLGCVALWRDFPARLAAATGCGVFAFSRAGYGGSDPVPLPRPLDYMTREACDGLPAVLDAVLGTVVPRRVVPRRVVLVGHSDGATIAAIHAGRVRDPRVAGIVLMAPHFFTEPVGLAAIAAAGAAFRTTDLKQRLGKHHRHPDIAFRGWHDAWLDPGFAAWTVAAVLDSVRVPVLALQGRDDQYGTLAQIEVVRQRVPAPVTVTVLDDCRHAPHLEQPAATLAAVAGFVRRVLAPGPALVSTP